jgi:hypothetical protein
MKYRADVQNLNAYLLCQSLHVLLYILGDLSDGLSVYQALAV